jgi:hypothetical protein
LLLAFPQISKINLERLRIADKRLGNVLRAHVIATARTLEQKIADAGPFNQRVDPHILTLARNLLVKQGIITPVLVKGMKWYRLTNAHPEQVEARLQEQQVVHGATQEKLFTLRLGQAAEIAVYRALLLGNELTFFGNYPDLDEHDDSTLYTKEEPPSAVNGRKTPGNKKLDFLLFHRVAGVAGVEVKNVREWMYPDRTEIREMIAKCLAIDAVPVLIARRIPYATFSVFNRCGIIIHQLYGQIYASADQALAEQARNKKLLGYHDIKVGNQPDARLEHFIQTNLPGLIGAAREKYELWKEELTEYASGAISYKEFIAKLRGTYVSPEEEAEQQEEADEADDHS